VQDQPRGIAEAFVIGKEFIGGDSCTLILGDNIYTDDFSEVIANHKQGAKIFVKKVSDANRFGVVEMNVSGQVLSIEEKPSHPKSNLAQTGLYVYDSKVTEYATGLKPSARLEYEITDLNNIYLEKSQLTAHQVKGEWIDAGTFESLHRASVVVREHELGIHKNNESSLKVTIREEHQKVKERTS